MQLIKFLQDLLQIENIQIEDPNIVLKPIMKKIQKLQND